MNILQEKVRKYMTDKPEYRAQNLNYMRYEMKMMDQEALISDLKDMNIKELQYCQGAGVPGHANTVVLQLLKQRKQEMQDYLNNQGSQRINTVDSEHKQSGYASVTVDDKEAWVDPSMIDKEVEDNGVKPVHTPKKGRKGHSKKI